MKSSKYQQIYFLLVNYDWVALSGNTDLKIMFLFYPVPILSKQGKVNIANDSNM